MKYGSFSDAIRVGAELRPQAFDRYFGNGGSCAYGAALEAITGKEDADPWGAVEAFGYLLNQGSSCPAGCDQPEPFVSIAAIIFHLNDDHRWAREQIADWLQSEEDKLGYVTITESVVEPTTEPQLTLVNSQTHERM